MNIKTIAGFTAIAGLLFIAAPTPPAQAASLISPGIAAAVQGGSIVGSATEVRWHRGWRRHHWHRRWHHRHHRHWRRW
jgi:hypothetical protein